MHMLSDDIPEWARSCPSGKQKFAMAEDARHITRMTIRRTRAKRFFKGTPHIYKCSQCSGFHVTTQLRKRNKRKGNRDT